MQSTRSSIKTLKSKIQNTALVLLITLAASCGGPDWNADQQAVHKAMRDWSAAVTEKDPNAMWEMLSPDAREWYKRELEGTGGVRMTVEMHKAALMEGSMISAERRRQIEAELANLPPEPDKMTAQEYYVWRVRPDLTAEGAERTAALFAKANITNIEIEGDRATVLLQNGDPDRYSWVRHSGVWKFDLKPSTLLALEEARARENKSN